NGWTRDTAQQLLVHATNRDDAVDSFQKIVALRMAVKEGRSPLARQHAICALDGLEAISVYELVDGIADKHSGVRKQAIRLSASRIGGKGYVEDMKIGKLLDDTDSEVRLQLAYSLGRGQDEPTGKLLAQLLVNHRDDRFVTAAVLSSVHRNN